MTDSGRASRLFRFRPPGRRGCALGSYLVIHYTSGLSPAPSGKQALLDARLSPYQEHNGFAGFHRTRETVGSFPAFNSQYNSYSCYYTNLSRKHAEGSIGAHAGGVEVGGLDR